MRKNALMAMALVSAGACGCAGHLPDRSDHENIQGVWLAQSESQNGHTRNVAYQYVFSGDTLAFKDETGNEMKYSFKLDAADALKLITIWPMPPLASSSPVSVAYELVGDSLTLAIPPAGLRPTELSDKNDQELIVCTRHSQPQSR